MLAGVCQRLAVSGETVSVVGRSRDKLAKLVGSTNKADGRIVALPVDYRETSAFAGAIRGSVSKYGPIMTAICWIHSNAAAAALAVADLIGNESSPRDYFHVLGSPSANPLHSDQQLLSALESSQGIIYHKIILGFRLTAGGSRWLMDDEICEGVLAAVNLRQREYVVGTVEPWSRRP